MRRFFIWFKRIGKVTWLVVSIATVFLCLWKWSGLGWADKVSWLQLLSPGLFVLGCFTVWVLFLLVEGLALGMRRDGDRRAQNRLSRRIKVRNRIDQGREPEAWATANRKVLETQALVRRRAKFWSERSAKLERLKRS